jgi:hypothetical protein
MGDSFILKRMYSETPTSSTEMRKGSRHPHEEKDAAVIEPCTTRMTASETKSPSVAVIWMKLV